VLCPEVGENLAAADCKWDTSGWLS